MLFMFLAYAALIACVAIIAMKFIGYLKHPQHLRWEHSIRWLHEEADRVKYGGSYLEKTNWWKEKQHGSTIGMLKVFCRKLCSCMPPLNITAPCGMSPIRSTSVCMR